MSIKVEPRAIPPARLNTAGEAAKPSLEGTQPGPELLNPKQKEALNRVAAPEIHQPPLARDRFVGDVSRGVGGAAINVDLEAARSKGKDYVVVSSNDDDPVFRPNNKEQMSKADFFLDEKGKPIGLQGPRAAVFHDEIIYRPNAQGQYEAFSNNPWSDAKPNSNGNFYYPREDRLPLHQIKRNPDGTAALDANGLQQWIPTSNAVGQTTAFEAVNAASHAAEKWAGRSIKWGEDGQLPIVTHGFVGFNAFFTPSGRALFFGVVPYRLPGEKDIKMFEMASAWEVAVHEAGHALHNDLKPNRGLVDNGYRTWGESFGDQMGMWTSLQDPDRAKAVIKETFGDMNRSNSVSAIGEVFAGLVGEGTGLRDAFHNKTVANTSPEYHDRSEVLTGAAYRVFVQIYNDLRLEGASDVDAVMKAADIMGTFTVRTTDFTPENTMTSTDVANAYLKVDKEYFGGKYGAVFAAEFQDRGIFDENSVAAFEAAEARIPTLSLGGASTSEEITALVKDNLDVLGVPAAYGLNLQSHEVNAFGEHIVRVELTEGRDADAAAIANHGLLVFNADGKLLGYQTPMPVGLDTAEGLGLLEAARTAGLDQQGKLGFVKTEEGQWTVAVVVPKPVETESGAVIGATYQVFDLEHPQGRELDLEGHGHDELLERYGSLLPSGAEIMLPEAA